VHPGGAGVAAGVGRPDSDGAGAAFLSDGDGLVKSGLRQSRGWGAARDAEAEVSTGYYLIGIEFAEAGAQGLALLWVLVREHGPRLLGVLAEGVVPDGGAELALS
jgi:hypothetical protein